MSTSSTRASGLTSAGESDSRWCVAQAHGGRVNEPARRGAGSRSGFVRPRLRPGGSRGHAAHQISTTRNRARARGCSGRGLQTGTGSGRRLEQRSARPDLILWTSRYWRERHVLRALRQGHRHPSGDADGAQEERTHLGLELGADDRPCEALSLRSLPDPRSPASTSPRRAGRLPVHRHRIHLPDASGLAQDKCVRSEEFDLRYRSSTRAITRSACWKGMGYERFDGRGRWTHVLRGSAKFERDPERPGAS
jgi:hypothetical protein